MKVRCIVCHQAKWGKKFPVGEKKEYVFCKSCYNWNLFPQPRRLAEIYTGAYFDNPPPQWVFWRLVFRIRLYPDYAKWVNSVVLSKGRLLDVGCGDGRFLGQMLSLGWDVYGADLSRAALEFTSSKIGKNRVFYGELHRIKKLKKGSFEVITFWHVLEHLTHPAKDLVRAYKLLRRGGHVFVEVPNGDSLVLRLFGRYYNWLRVSEHTVYWTREGLAKFFRKTGFRKTEIFSPAKGNLNLALSFYNWLEAKNLPWGLPEILFMISLPFSVMMALILPRFGRGEVLRVVAKKT